MREKMIYFTVQTDTFRASFDSPAETYQVARKLASEGKTVEILTYFKGCHTETETITTQDI